jgi:2-methylcitrate dehydratase PrpD
LSPTTSSSTGSGPGATHRIANFVGTSQWADVPARVRHEAKRSILNFFGTALGGSRDPATEAATAVLSRFSATPEATLVGRAERVGTLDAAFLNAVSGNVFDFDDTHYRTIIHPTAPVSPALFALAERQRLSGADLLHAFVLGVEIECRIGNAVSPGHYSRGWHITSTCGVFGSAAATAKVLGLDLERTIWAMGNAAAQSAGLIENLGTMAKSISVGNAARGGLLAAFLAEAGLAGPAEPISGQRGFTSVMADGANVGELTNGLGETWEILDNAYKPYPCGVVLNPVIDACFELRDRPGFATDDISRVIVEGHPLLRQRADRPGVTTGREAQVSAQHTVAVALLRGAAGVREYTDAVVNAPDIRAFASRVEVSENDAIPVGAAQVRLLLASGSELVARIDDARGSPTKPLTDSEIEAKVRDLAVFGCPSLDVEPLIAAVWALDRSEDAGTVMALTRPR